MVLLASSDFSVSSKEAAAAPCMDVGPVTALPTTQPLSVLIIIPKTERGLLRVFFFFPLS